MNVSATHKTSRVILATPRAIFRTLLDPETIPAWRAPKGMSARIEHFDPRPGGTYRMALHPSAGGTESKSGDDTNIDVEFVEILAEERIIERVRFDTADPRLQGTMTLTTLLEPVKDGTKVTLTADDVPQGFSEADHEEGMALTLRNLANFVE
ncbi:SRPBCC domain-containing protein [Sphingopyxis sp. 22461]|jgi:uncharacterized protein YndB with AHSA1/START domain|uniref:SRPBCC domain-containing protein n=1 Tax=Sphingopyxis sp. 22461 TaxID=3453923 RepID=UPI003F87D2B7